MILFNKINSQPNVTHPFMFKIQGEAVRYILFQRTEFMRIPKSSLYRIINKISPFNIYNTVVHIESFLNKKKIGRLYYESMLHEYTTIKNYLPDKCRNVLDIGCGMAGIDFFLYVHYKNAGETPPHLFLLDKTALDKRIFYGFKQSGAFYNSLDLAKSFLINNGLDESNITLLNATEDNSINITGPVDLVISLLSWGFHYPIATYLDKVYKLLSDNGYLILDVRKATDGLKHLREAFGPPVTTIDSGKFLRVVLRKAR